MSTQLHETTRLKEAVAEAHRLAHQGQSREGYDLLDLTLCWIESPLLDLAAGDIRPPAPWENELVETARAALVAYAESHDLRFATPEPGDGEA
jgi:hypothetical protein